MAVCSRCGGALAGTARFCPACGSPVAPAPRRNSPPPDPLARTVPGDPTAAAPTQPGAVSPMASSVMSAPVPALPPPGTVVLVHWADGKRYPGTVLQGAGNAVLVAFPSGQQQWVDARYVSTGT